jgi:hypothetical protein
LQEPSQIGHIEREKLSKDSPVVENSSLSEPDEGDERLENATLSAVRGFLFNRYSMLLSIRNVRIHQALVNVKN